MQPGQLRSGASSFPPEMILNVGPKRTPDATAPPRTELERTLGRQGKRAQRSPSLHNGRRAFSFLRQARLSMADVPYLETHQVAEGDRELLSRDLNIYRAMVHSPDAARAFQGFGRWIREKSKLAPRLREL